MKHRSPTRRRLLVALTVAMTVTTTGAVATAAPAPAASGTVYYVDSQAGSDRNTGVTPSAPWQSLAKINSSSFRPGDQVLLKGGSQWSGTLTLTSSGTAQEPIVLGAYGTGRPRIDGHGTVRDAVQVLNAHDVIVQDLEVTNSADITRSIDQVRRGIYVEGKDVGELAGITIRNNFVHHVDGRGRSGGIGVGGIAAGVRGNAKPTWFSGLRITGNEVSTINAYGISTYTTWCARCTLYSEPGVPNSEVGSSRVPFTGLRIDSNYVHDVTGGGITPQHADYAVVERNTVDRAASNQVEHGNGNVGIWWQGTRGILVQYNTVRHTAARGIYQTIQPIDAMAFDADIDTANSTVQYNISEGNNGGFFMCLVSANNNVVRHNVSVNDHRLVFRLLRGCYNTRAYNNTIWGTAEPTPTLTGTGEQGPPVPAEGVVINESNAGHTLVNNIFYNPAKAPYVRANERQNSFSHNLYWDGSPDTLVPTGDPSALVADPKLANPAATLPADGFITPAQFDAYFRAFTPAASSPVRNAGVSIDGPIRDALGTRLPAGSADLGAIQHAVPVTVTTTLGTSGGTAAAIADGDLRASWASADNPVLPGTVTLSYAEPRTFDALTIATAFGQGQGVTRVGVETWNGSAWVAAVPDAAAQWAGNTATVEFAKVALPTAVTTDRVRLTVKSAGLQWGHLAINEVSLSYRGVAATDMGELPGSSVANLVDGDPATSWASRGATLGYLQVDSPVITARSLTLKVAFGQGQGPTAVSVQALNGDNGRWQQVLGKTAVSWSSNTGTVEERTLTFPAPVTATRFEIRIHAANLTWGHVALNDVTIR